MKSLVTTIVAVAALTFAACASSRQASPPPAPQPVAAQREAPAEAQPATATSIAVAPEPSPEPVTEPPPPPEEKVARAGARDDSVEAKGGVAQLRQRVLASQRQWNAALADHGGKYTYATGFGSWVGFGRESTVKVDGGKVVQHSYLEYNREGATTTQWMERGAAVGSHGGTPPTIDQLYAQCLKDVLTKSPNDHAFYVAFFKNGLLADCSVRHKQCADDCSEGPEIWFVRWE